MQHVALQRQHVTYNAHCRTLCRRGDGLQSRLGPNNIPRSTWQADAALHSLQVRETRLSWNESKGVTYARQPNHAVWDMTCFCKSRKDGATGPLCCAGISRSRCCMRRSSGSRCASTASATTAHRVCTRIALVGHRSMRSHNGRRRCRAPSHATCAERPHSAPHYGRLAFIWEPPNDMVPRTA